MPLLFLKVDKRTKWHSGVGNRQPQLNDAPADIIADFRVSSSHLSVYLMDENLERAERTAVAFACNRDVLQDSSYLLFDAQIVDGLGLARIDKPGDLPDHDVAQWHQDIVVETIRQLCELIHAIWG